MTDRNVCGSVCRRKDELRRFDVNRDLSPSQPARHGLLDGVGERMRLGD